MAALLGIGLGIGFILSDYRISRRMAKILYGINIFMLLLVLSPLGTKVNGARSWLFFFQPAEISKLILIFTLAELLNRKTDFNSCFDLIGPMVHIGIPFLLICLQPNLGTGLVLLFILFLMLYMAGVPGVKLLSVILAGALGVSLIFLSHHYLHTPLPVKQYQIARLTSFIDPEKDATGSGWHLRQAIIAVGSGQFFGKGFLRGTQGRLGYLPESSTDFIFSVYCEEFGFCGAFLVLFLYFLLIRRGILIASRARERMGGLVGVGVVAMLLFHVLENTGMNLGIMPIAGIPLPFISFGGTSMAVNIIAVAILLNIWGCGQGLIF